MKSLRRQQPKLRILDPQGNFLQRWNKIFVVSCIVAVAVDPLFFYIPLIKRGRFCLDGNVELTASVLRSLVDIVYVFRIILQFRTAFIAPSSRVFGRGELVLDSKAIAKRYLCSYFIVDVLSILPLPQLVIPLAAYVVNWPVSDVTRELLYAVVFIQYAPRILRIYPLYRSLTTVSGIFSETAWAGAASNFFFYVLASHVTGSFWYLMSVERVDTCWRLACEAHRGCKLDDLYCGRGHQQRDNSFLVSTCSPPQRSGSTFDYGIFLDALSIHRYQSFFQRSFYCFVWGLRNLSSLGQNLETSNAIGENLFVVVISITGLILFSFLAGNIQRYLHTLTVRADEMRLRLRDQEQWMSHDMLPQNLRMRVRRHEQLKWQKRRGVDKESLIKDLPNDLRMDIKRHQCLSLLKRVPMFEKLDEMALNALCCFLKPVLYSVGSYILREGDHVDEMIFITKGDVSSVSISCGSGFFDTVILKPGDFFGEELLMWALHPNSSSTTLPISTKICRTMNDVEAFSLIPDDLKCVLSCLGYHHSNQLRHVLRFYSEEWRLWGACTVQAAWRKYYMRKMGRSLNQTEDSFPRLLPQKPINYDLTSQF